MPLHTSSPVQGKERCFVGLGHSGASLSGQTLKPGLGGGSHRALQPN